MNTTSKATSAQLNKIKLDALDLIRDIRDAQHNLSSIKSTAGELGLSTQRKENESELEYLSRLAEEACDAEHATSLAEAKALVQATAQGHIHRPEGPRSMIGRILSKAANAIG